MSVLEYPRSIALPHDRIPGVGLIVASCWYNSDGSEQLVLALADDKPYFRVAIIAYKESHKAFSVVSEKIEENIVPAVDTYKDWGGDY